MAQAAGFWPAGCYRGSGMLRVRLSQWQPGGQNGLAQSERKRREMTIKTWWIPKSKRGRQIAKLLKNAGYKDASYQNVAGRYVCNLFCYGELAQQPWLLREIAYALDPEEAYYLDLDVEALAQDLLDDYGSTCSEKQAFDEAFKRVFV